MHGLMNVRLIALPSLKFQRLKKNVPSDETGICQTHILRPSVNKGVTAEEVRPSEKVSSFIN
jgi:hypothetical protein